MSVEIQLTSGPDLWPQLGSPTGEAVSISGLQGNDTITGTSFSDEILGNEGNDVLSNGQGNDTIFGGQGDDTIAVALGNNLLFGNLGEDSILLGTGSDTVFAGRDNDIVRATTGNSFIYGNLGNDSLVAGSGNDYIHGGQDEDTIVANGGGTDSLIGGLGNDFLVFATNTTSNGSSYDGSDGLDNLLVNGNNDFSGTSLSSLEVFDIGASAVAIFSQSNLTQAQVTNINGSGSIQAAPDPANPNRVITLNLAGITVAGTIVIRDSAGNVVGGGGGTDNPSDPDKLRPIQGSLTVQQDDLSLNGRIDAPLVTGVGDVFTVPSLQSGDRVRGLGESDVLTARIGSNNSLTLVPPILPQVVDVETINFTPERLGSLAGAQGTSTQPFLYDASQTTGTTKFVSSDNTGVLRIRGIRNNAEVILRNASTGLQTTFASNVSGVATIRLQNVRAADNYLSVEPQAGAGFSTWNIYSEPNEGQTGVTNELGAVISRVNGGTPQTSGGTALRTVNITGQESLTLNTVTTNGGIGFATLPQEVLTINAGGTLKADGTPDLTVFEGDLTIEQVPDSDLSFTGGKGDDDINFGTTLNDKDILNGGEGTDTVSAQFNNTLTSTLKIASFENFVITNTANVTLPMNDVTGLETITFTSTPNITQTQITGITVLPSVIFTGNGGLTNQQIDALSINGTGADDTLKVEFNNGGVAVSGGSSFQAEGIKVESVENIDITVKDANIQFRNDIGISPYQIDGDNSLRSVKFTSVGNVTGVTGASNLLRISVTPLPGVNALDGITTVDASAVEGQFRGISSALARGARVTLGKGNSIFDATGSANDISGAAGTTGVTIIGQGGDDQITGTFTSGGNGGNDVITGAGGADILTGNGGNDRFVYNSLLDSLLNTRDEITDFTPGANADTIRVPQNIRLDLGVFGLGAGQSRFITSPTASNFSAVLGSLEANRVAVINDPFNTYVVFNDGNVGFSAGSDSVIQLSGVDANLATGNTSSLINTNFV